MVFGGHRVSSWHGHHQRELRFHGTYSDEEKAQGVGPGTCRVTAELMLKLQDLAPTTATKTKADVVNRAARGGGFVIFFQGGSRLGDVFMVFAVMWAYCQRFHHLVWVWMVFPWCSEGSTPVCCSGFRIMLYRLLSHVSWWDML